MQKNQILHSRYNPKAEAERFLDSIEIKKDLKIIILIEPGMGYMTALLRSKNPNSKIIALHAEHIPELLPLENIPDACWAPNTDISLRHFLENEVSDMESHDIKIIEWRPALSVYGESYRKLLEVTVEFIKQADASARTQNIFGKIWFKNFFSNLSIISNIIIPDTLSCPVLITGSGPGLEDSFEEIKHNEDQRFLLAASSSFTALEYKNIKPDMIITTDGGNWALMHLYECVRSFSDLKLAINICASVPSQCKQASFFIISDGSLWQSLILKELNIPFIILPQRGTVTATAIDLAFFITKSNVIITGIDLVHKDLQNHARPYSFDKLWEEKANRLVPYYSQMHYRSNMIKDGGSYNIYSSWFSHQISKYPRQLYTCNKNNSVFDSLESISLKDSSSNNKKHVFKTIKVSFDDNPAKLAVNILLSALKNDNTKDKIFEELKLLLYTTTTSVEELSSTILNLTQYIWKNNLHE